MPTTETISNEHERQHLQEHATLVQKIERYYLQVLAAISPLIAAKAPRAAINRKLNAALADMVMKTTAAIENSMTTSWDIANKRTSQVVEEAYKGMQLPDPVKDALKDHRHKALKQFIKQKEDGLNLSERVWKSADQYRDLINQHIDEGLKEGKPAAKISRNIREALKNPAKQEKPGQGVYKSPLKNAERLGRTQVNMAYRMSDQEAWAANPLVLGYRVSLSATGKPKVRCELCRTLEGEYPVTFVFRGWHPHCLCFKIPILMSREMLDQYNKLVAQGKDTPEAIEKLQKGVRIMEPPAALSKWVTANQERVEGWKNLPYWWKDNQGVMDGILKPVV
ncbi:MAG TPA: hypothetical protein VGE26_02690 [Sphingobacteriaceae bacterium]